ncbi:MAG: hypothetical protein ABIL39_04825 [candidate division WOR-3 bacterium]
MPRKPSQNKTPEEMKLNNWGHETTWNICVPYNTWMGGLKIPV